MYVKKSRNRAVIKNIVWELGYYVVVVLAGILLPREIILAYGSEINGLSTTITQVMQILLLLQSGAISVAIFSLYGPVANNELEKVGLLLDESNRYFRKVALLFIMLALMASIVASNIISTSIKKEILFLSFFMMGIKNFLDLFFVVKYRILFTVYQEKFIISLGTLLEHCIYYLFALLTIYNNWSFVFLYIGFLFGVCFKIVFLNKMYIKNFGKMIIFNGIDNSAIGINNGFIKGINYSFANEVSHTIVAASIFVFTTLLYGLEEASVLSIYMLVFQALMFISTAIYSSFAPSFGNVIGEGNKKIASDVFHIFQFIFYLLNTFMIACMAYLLIPFVSIYTLGVTDINYINYRLVILLLLYAIFYTFRIPFNVIVSTCGYFKETWMQPVVTLFLSLIVSFFLGGIRYEYIFFGPILFYMINFVYQYFKLKKLNPFYISHKVFLMLYNSIFIVGISYVCIFYIKIEPNIFSWIVGALYVSIGIFILLVITSILFFRVDLALLTSYVMERIKGERNG